MAEVEPGFFLIEALGNQASTWVANILNLAVAGAALGLWKQVRHTDLDRATGTGRTLTVIAHRGL